MMISALHLSRFHSHRSQRLMIHSQCCSCHQFILIFRHNFCLCSPSNFLSAFMSSLWSECSRIIGISGYSFHKNCFLYACVLIKANSFPVSKIFFNLVTYHLLIRCLGEFTFVYFGVSLNRILIFFFRYHKYQNHYNPKCFKKYFPCLLVNSFWTWANVW